MNLTDLTKSIDSAEVIKQIKDQFGVNYKIDRLGLKEAVDMLNNTEKLIVAFKQKHNIYESQNDASYMKLVMLHEAANKKALELTNKTKVQESQMENKLFTKALKIAAMGGQLTEQQLQALRVSEDMQSVLRSKPTAQKFMQKIVESKKMLKENELSQAQNTMAAKDIANSIQGMIEKFADIKYKELPALHDSIRDSQGVDAATSFNEQLTASLDELTTSLESAKGDVNNAVAELTGEEVAATGAGDLDLDDFEGGDEIEGEAEFDMDIDAELDLDGGDDFEIAPEEDDEEVDLGRERR